MVEMLFILKSILEMQKHNSKKKRRKEEKVFEEEGEQL